MTRERWWPPLVGLTALGSALLVALLPAGAAPPVPVDQGRPASIPARVADYSYLTGDASASPAGRAVAIFQHGFGVEFLDLPQAVVVSADSDAYRRLDVAEDRAGPETQGDAAPMLLSPDGIRVAVGDYDIRRPDLALVDLDTGDVELYPVPGGHSVIPLAWSPDSSRVAYLSAAEPTNPYSGTAIRGNIGILEPATGQARLLPGNADVRAAAFSPDGTELAIHRIPPDGGTDGTPRLGGGTVDVLGLDDGGHRQLSLPPGQYLDGPNAWSPDGTLLATRTQQAGATIFIDASGLDVPVPAPLPASLVGSHGVLGWASSGEVVVLDDVGDSDRSTAGRSGLHWVTAVPLDGRSPRRLSAVPGGGNYGVGSFQLAAGLLPELQVREAAAADRGRWPTQLRVGVAFLCAGVAWLLAELVRRRRTSRSTATGSASRPAERRVAPGP